MWTSLGGKPRGGADGVVADAFGVRVLFVPVVWLFTDHHGEHLPP